MPRLVLVPTAARVASTAPQDARAHPRAGRRSGPGRGLRAADEVAAVIRWPSAKTCTLPGFGASSSSRQAATNAAAMRSRSRRPSGAPRASPQRRDKIAGEDRRDVDRRHLLQTGPGRHAVDLEHGRPPSAPYRISTPAKCGADRRRRRDREILHRDRRHDRRDRPAALLHVGDPAGRSGAPSRRPRGRCDTSRRKSRKPLALDARRSAAGNRRRRPRPAPAARPALRIRRSPRPCEPNSGLSTSGPRAHSRRTISRAVSRDSVVQVARRRNAGAGEQEAGHRLVDAALDRARVVPHRHAEFAQRMEHAEPQRDRLEACRPTWCAPCTASGRLSPKPGMRQARRRCGVEPAGLRA